VDRGEKDGTFGRKNHGAPQDGFQFRDAVWLCSLPAPRVPRGGYEIGCRGIHDVPPGRWQCHHGE